MIASIQANIAEAIEAMEGARTHVEGGVVKTNLAGEALGEIEKLVKEITSMNIQVAAATDEQAATTKEIYENIQRAFETTEAVKESTLAMYESFKELDSMSEKLNREVEQFKLNGRVKEVAAMPASPPPGKPEARAAVM